MPKKRNSFLTVVFSALPGAGHMYMGFMKLGVSFMSLFFAVIFLSSWLQIGALMYIIPVLWFYSFFDCLNRCFSSNEQFACMQDHYLIPLEKVSNSGSMQGKTGIVAGTVLLIFGIYLIWINIMNSVLIYLPDYILQTIRNATSALPRLLIGILILVIGIKLILGRKKEADGDDR